VTALPLSAFAVDMHGGLSLEPAQTVAHLPAEASISVLPSALTPSAWIMIAPRLAPQAAPESAAKADVEAMVAPKEAIVPAGEDVSKMSGDQASGAGEAIMDRILYIKGTPASGTAAPVAGSQTGSASQLKPSRPGPLYYLLAGPAKIATKSTEFISGKTRIPPFWTALALSGANLVGSMRAMLGPSWDVPMPGSHMSHPALAAFAAFTVMAVMYLGHASWWMKQDAERDALKKLDAAVSKAQDSVKAVPGVLSVAGQTIPGKNANDHAVVIRVTRLDAANIGKIPQKIDGLSVRVEFAR